MSRTTALLVALVLAFVLLEVVPRFFGPYELFHDELYYWVCARHLELGYVDHPPLTPWILAAATAVVGDGRFAFVWIPALAGGGTVFLTGLIARRLGAGRFGQLLAALCVAMAPVVLVFSSFYSVNAFEVLLWTATCYLVVELIRTGNERFWLGIGVVVGLGLLNKHTFALLGFGLVVGMLATPMRAELRRRSFWFGVLAAVLLALPNLYWNFENAWPSLAFYRSRDAVGNLPTSIAQALILQVMSLGAAAVLVWVPGALFLLLSRRGRPYRPLGIAFLTLLVIMLVSGQRRSDRIAGIYPIVFAAGATFWDQYGGRWRRGIRWTLVALVVVVGAVGVPAALPLLPPQQVASYFKLIGAKPDVEPADVGQDVPQYLLGRLDWKRLAKEVVEAWGTLPQEERDRSVILAPHWVFASVVEYYGRDRALPPVVAPHNAYYFWRQDAAGRDIAVSVAVKKDALARYFATTRELTTFRCEYCMSFRSDLPIIVSYRPIRPLPDLLAEWRHFGLDAAPALRR